MNPCYRIFRSFIASLLVFAASGCVDNDLPKPSVTVNIAAIKGKGFEVKEIDVVNRTVVLSLDETTDIQNVPIDSVGFQIVPHNVSVNLDLDAARASIAASERFPGVFPMDGPLHMTLSLFEDFEWTIRAEQTIDRRFRVAGQVGKPVFDVGNCVATAYVRKDADLSSVAIEELRLGPDELTTYLPTLDKLNKDFASSSRRMDVFCHGRKQEWTICVKPTDKNVQIPVEEPEKWAWPGIIWLTGSGIEGEKVGFRYRKIEDGAASHASSRADDVTADSEWLEVPAEQVTVSGGSFEGYLNREPDTAYEIKAYCGADETDPYEVPAEPAPPALRNGGFEEWSTSGSKNTIYPYLADAEPYWSTGNPGAAMANETLTEWWDPRPGSQGRYSAHLKSKFANLMGIGKFAAGNIFLGEYVKTDGTNGLLRFGRAFTARPAALRLWVKFKGGTIDYAGKDTPAGVGVGTPDNGSIFIALGTWKKEDYGWAPATVNDLGGQLVGTDDSPVCIATREISTLFKPTGPDVVGYGEFMIVDDIDDWTQVTIPIRYTDKGVVPTNLMIVCAASRWGDYFTGSTRSEMWLDDLELIYDYVDPDSGVIVGF
ncbi:MAG: PCMD domain-containing protein [Alistipes senegalensis]|nr:PCMD domain-containing protein [Bacteroides cellulosilyticus]MCM1351155.1 PCMD domain-containing protein [Alistipes senegalensis]